MTNTALKAQIDSQITNETTANAITPTDVGTNMKAIVDYVDQEIPYQSYVSLVSFSSDGTPQVITVLSNIVDGITYTQTGTGVYELISNGKFTSNKTIINPFVYQGSTSNSGAVRLPIYSSDAIVGYYWLQRTSTNTVLLNVVDTSQSPINPFTLLGTRRLTIDVKVYN
jgi:hypothetical protein